MPGPTIESQTDTLLAVAPQRPSVFNETDLTSVHKAMGDPTRLRIVAILAGSELRVSEIVAILEMGQSRISRHLRILVEAHVLSLRRSGVWTFYRLDENGTFQSIVTESLTLYAGNERDTNRKQRVLAERRNETKHFFDSRAAQWDSMKVELFGEVDPDRIAVECVFDCSTVADLGCGDGTLVALLSQSANLVIGVDNAPAMIDFARERLESQSDVEFRLGEVEHLPLRDGEVNGAVMSLVLHHLPEPKLAIQESSRVLSERGRLAVLELSPHDNEILRDRHGDRWLGIEKTRVEKWIEETGLFVEEQKEYKLSGGLTLYAIVASKTGM